jgi:hypothetical protein
MSNPSVTYRSVVAALALLVSWWRPASAQIIETETARIPKRGHFEFGTGYEFQTSAAGTEHATPIALEGGLTDRFALLVEPVPYTSIRPKHAARSTGPGDLEITGTYVALPESGKRPAIALAIEAKIPTARNVNIGTTKADYAGYLIMSKRAGRFDSHANLGYTIVGQPAGVQLSNIFNAALATEFHASDANLLFAEVLGTTAASAEGESGSDSVTTPAPEAAGSELVGTFGAAHFVSRGVLLSFSLSYDSTHAWLYRPGITISF